MLQLTLKGLAANKARFTLTTFAVVLAVSFVVSSFVLTDGLRRSFDDLSVEAVGSTDLVVRPVTEFGDPVPLPESALEDVRAADGVADAAPQVQAGDNAIRPLTPEGEEIPGNGAPQVAFNWVDDPALNQFTIETGEAPTGPGQFVMDLDAAAKNGFEVGGTYDLVTTTGPVTATLTGITRFGDDNATLGATLLAFETDWLQELTLTDGYDAIAIRVDTDADLGQVAENLTEALAGTAPETEVIDQTTLVSESQADFDEGIDILGTVLLGFAGISLFVSVFIIYNTFSIVLGQRTRELGLLRAIGADTRQIRRSVLGEAVVVGLLASAVGIGAGVLLALGLRALFNALGAELPDSDVIVAVRTILVGLTVGLGATMVSAVGPARKAARVAPIAALRDGIDAGQARRRTRMMVGTALTAVGAAAVAGGLFAAETASSVMGLLALGAAGVFVGITMLSPLVAEPITAAAGWPLRRLFGTSGRLATQNAGRNPHRTATTAAALMIGLALVSMVLVVGESVKAQLTETLESSVHADYLVTDDAGFGFAPDVREELAAVPATAAITSFRFEEMQVDGELAWVDATDLAIATELIDFDVVEGSGSDTSVADPVLVAEQEATEKGLSPGDEVSVTTSTGGTAELTVVGIFADDFVIEDPYLMDLTTWNELGASQEDGFLAFDLADGVTEADADVAFATISERYPQVTIESSAGFVERAQGFIDQGLATVNVLVALAVVIALIGIANTLALSVYERTRELGLLRAVGMTRRQVRRMIRLEAGLVALFGAGLGVAVGIAFGWAAVVAMPSSITSTLAIPGFRIVVLVVVAAAAGLVAAWGPARRAGKLDVLDAIAH